MNGYNFYSLVGNSYTFSSYYSCIASETNEFHKLGDFKLLIFVKTLEKNRIELYLSTSAVNINTIQNFCSYIGISAYLKIRKIDVSEFIKGYEEAVWFNYIYKDSLFKFCLKSDILKQEEEEDG